MPRATSPVMPGTRFGRLTTVGVQFPKREKSGHNRAWVNTRCDCGAATQVQVNNLKSGNTSSCGCLQRERTAARMTTHGATARGSRPALYRVWKGMRARCEDPKAQNYKWYGGRGVTVCEEWHDFATFRTWAESSGYAPGLELDRLDSDKSYSPDNCQWRTKKANLRSRDLCWSDDLDAQVVRTAKRLGISPYDLIRQAVEAYLDPGQGLGVR